MACGGAPPPTVPIDSSAPLAPPDAMACRYQAADGTLDRALPLYASVAATAPFGYLVHAPPAALGLPLAPAAPPARVEVTVADDVATMTAYAEPRATLALAASVEVHAGLRAGPYATWNVHRSDADRLAVVFDLPDLVDVDGATAEHRLEVELPCGALRPGPPPDIYVIGELRGGGAPLDHAELPKAVAPIALRDAPSGAITVRLRAPYALTVVELEARPPWHRIAYEDAGMVAHGWVEAAGGLTTIGVGSGGLSGSSSGSGGIGPAWTCPSAMPLRVAQGGETTVIGEIAAGVPLRASGPQPSDGAAIRLPWLIARGGAQLVLTAAEIATCTGTTTAYSDHDEPM